jgi:hypothetical protein
MMIWLGDYGDTKRKGNPLVLHPGGELREELPRKVVGIGWVDDILAADIVVENSTIGSFVDVGQGEIQAMAFDSAGYATNEDDRAIRFLPFDDPDVRERVVHFAITIVVPGIVEEDEIARVDNRPQMKRALLAYMRMDEADAIGVRVAGFTAVKIDPVFEKNRAGHPGTIVGDTPTLAFNGFGAYELDRSPHNRGSAGRWLDGSTTWGHLGCRCARAPARRSGTAHERYNRDRRYDEEDSHRSHRTLTNRPCAISLS